MSKGDRSPDLALHRGLGRSDKRPKKNCIKIFWKGV
jgi:hypothetical protein